MITHTFAIFKCDDSFLHVIYDRTVMGRDDDRFAFAIESIKDMHNFFGIVRIKITRWFVTNNDIWIMDEGASDTDALSFSSRKIGDKCILF